LRQVAGTQIQARPALLEAIGGQQVVDQVAQTSRVLQHGVQKAGQALRIRLSQTDGFQVQLQGRQGRLEFVADLRKKIPVGQIEIGLAAPVNEDDIDPRQDHPQQNQPFHQQQPVQPALQQFRMIALGQHQQLAVAFKKPGHPTDHHQHPGQLDDDKSDDGIDEAAQGFHRPCLSSVRAPYKGKNSSPAKAFTELLQSPQGAFARIAVDVYVQQLLGGFL